MTPLAWHPIVPVWAGAVVGLVALAGAWGLVGLLAGVLGLSAEDFD